MTVDHSSPWGQRLWFDDHEFDAMMDEVRLKAGQHAVTPGRGVSVEAILESVFKVVPDYVSLPEGVLGKTVFHRDGTFEVFISRALSDEADSSDVARRRLRATLAHECAHIVEHGHLHLVDGLTLPLFGMMEPPTPKVLCRREAVGSFSNGRYDGQWWEFQANRGMASLLLPKREVSKFVQDALTARKRPTFQEAFAAREAESIVRELMQLFDVSMQAAIYRLQELHIVSKDTKQTALAFEDR
jgi:hypothetical protein